MAIGDVKARIVRSDGQEMTLGDGEWRIPKDGLENWANLPYSVSSVEIPSYDGALVTSKRVSAVDRTITAVAMKSDESEALRALAIKFFNPKFSFSVYLTYMGRTRWCRGEQIGFKASEGNIYENVEITWTLLCPNPYLLSVNDFGRDIAEVVPRFGFPWGSYAGEQPAPVARGFIVGERVFQKKVEIGNDGDVPSGMVATITAKGDVLNPLVRIGDGTVRIITAMSAGDVAVLDASSRPPRLTINGENAMHLLDRNSSILDMMIQPGKTTVEYDADDGDQYMSVNISYYKQYLGV